MNKIDKNSKLENQDYINYNSFTNNTNKAYDIVDSILETIENQDLKEKIRLIREQSLVEENILNKNQQNKFKK